MKHWRTQTPCAAESENQQHGGFATGSQFQGLRNTRALVLGVLVRLLSDLFQKLVFCWAARLTFWEVMA